MLPEDVVWTYAGVRPLYDDGASDAKAATRDYVFELDTPGGLPLLSIFGGKITTYRRLSEEALEQLSPSPAGHQRQPRGGPPARRCPVATWTSLQSARSATNCCREYAVPRHRTHADRLARASGTARQAGAGARHVAGRSGPVASARP